MKASEYLARRYEEASRPQDMRDRAVGVLRAAVLPGLGPMERLLLMAVAARCDDFSPGSCTSPPVSAADLSPDLGVSAKRAAEYVSRAVRAGWLTPFREPGGANRFRLRLDLFLRAETAFEVAREPRRVATLKSRKRGEGDTPETGHRKLVPPEEELSFEAAAPPAPRPDSSPSREEVEDLMSVDPSGLSRALRGRGKKGPVASVAREFAAPEPPKAPPPPEADRKLVAAYVTLMRSLNPLWEPFPSTAEDLRRVEAALRARRISPGLWSSYVRFAFERVAHARGDGDRAVPVAARTLASERMIAAFEEHMPPTRIDWRKAKELLKARGYHGMMTHVVEIAKALLEGRPPPRAGDGGAAAAAAAWVVENVELIGVVEIDG